MRLINCVTGEMEGSGDWGPTTPPYAILSHTWAQPQDGDLPEVTFQDYSAGRAAVPGKDWDKIDRAIEICAREGIGYVWLDTCCINKESSAELSEAINSSEYI